jgi:Flp pilus assembly pilin Flp
MKAVLRRFVRDEQGLETVEYAVMTALIVAGLILAVYTLGQTIKTQFQNVDNEINNPSGT